MPILEPDINHSAAYGYDRLNRLQVGLSDQNNNETGIAYDLMGNLTSLKRYTTNTLTDQLTYTYTGNQLSNVADATASNTGLPAGTTNYTYDGNGNMLTQSNTVNTASNKTVTYNLLNLPQSITIPNGTVTYTYDATGQKLRKVAVINGITTTTEYIAGIQYKNSTTAVDFIQTEEGRAAPNGTGYDYIYYLGDNLGNTRRTFGTKTGSAVLYQSDDYLPFGLEINNSVSSPKNEYLYNKKELQEELGEYDYGARFYDPVIGRWNVVDPMAEQYRRWSPYNYVENDPIRLTDPDGMSLPGFQNQDDDPGKEKENSKKKTSLDYDLQYAANKAGFELGKSAGSFGGDFVGKEDSGGDPEKGPGNKGTVKAVPKASAGHKPTKVTGTVDDPFSNKETVEIVGAVAGYSGTTLDVTTETAKATKLLKMAKIAHAGGLTAVLFGTAADVYLTTHIDPKTGKPYLSRSQFAGNTTITVVALSTGPVGVAVEIGNVGGPPLTRWIDSFCPHCLDIQPKNPNQ